MGSLYLGSDNGATCEWHSTKLREHIIIVIVNWFSPTTNIKELPSISTICCARTAVLIIIQILAAYHPGKAKKWGQLFTDAIATRQISFQNQVISVEEDDLFK